MHEIVPLHDSNNETQFLRFLSVSVSSLRVIFETARTILTSLSLYIADITGSCLRYFYSKAVINYFYFLLTRAMSQASASFTILYSKSYDIDRSWSYLATIFFYFLIYHSHLWASFRDLVATVARHTLFLRLNTALVSLGVRNTSCGYNFLWWSNYCPSGD